MGQQVPEVGLRPYLPQDAEICAAIFADSISELTSEDYSPAQQDAWIARADDLESFGGRLADALTLLATFSASPVGFVSLAGNERIDLLYVHPSAARQGVASALLDAIEKLALARGAKHLLVDASDNAAPLFAQRGYEPQQRNTIPIGDEWLGNTTMKKNLAA